jgi:hypothetical protein
MGNYYYCYDNANPLKPFVRTTFINPNAKPRQNATLIPCEVVEGYWPVWTGAGWENIEDHRGEKGYLGGAAFEVSDLGPYPEGWSATPPEPTAEEQAAALKARRIARLAAIDLASIRPLRAMVDETATQDDIDKLAALEAEAAAIRAKLANNAPEDESDV